MGSTRGLGNGINGGVKRNNGDLEIRSENIQESDEKVIRDPQSCDHGKHLLTEKRRRKKMKIMFQELQALLPEQAHKSKLITIVDDAISHIRNLQQTLHRLEAQKLERLNRPSTNTNTITSSTAHLNSISCPKFAPFYFPLRSNPAFQTWGSSNVTLHVCGHDAHINICASKKPGLLYAISQVLEKCNLDIVTFHISSDQSKNMFMFHVRVNTPEEFLAAYSYEEIFKLAALEMMVLAN